MVAVAKTNFDELKYRDESVFFFENENEGDFIDNDDNDENEGKDESEDEASSPSKRAKTVE